jgi:hypothetical protein
MLTPSIELIPEHGHTYKIHFTHICSVKHYCNYNGRQKIVDETYLPASATSPRSAKWCEACLETNIFKMIKYPKADKNDGNQLVLRHKTHEHHHQVSKEKHLNSIFVHKVMSGTAFKFHERMA